MRVAIVGFMMLSLAACGSVGKKLDDMRVSDQINVGLCPNVFVLEDAATMIDFTGEPSLDTVAWSAEITDVRTNCRYVEDRPIRAEVEIDFAVGRGPAADGHMKQLGYFVAVTRRNRALIAKQEYVVPVRIKGDIATVRFSRDISQITIPRKDSGISGTNFEIAVGLTLTRDQIIYNRSGQSLKFPNL